MPFPAVPSFLLSNKAPAAVPSFLKKRSTPSGVDAAASAPTGSLGNNGGDGNNNFNTNTNNGAESPADERVGPQSAVRSTDTNTGVGPSKVASTPPAAPEGRSNANGSGSTSSGVGVGVSGCGQAVAAPMNRVALIKDTNDKPSSSGCGGEWETTSHSSFAVGSARPPPPPFIINQAAQGTANNSSGGIDLTTNQLNMTVLGGDATTVVVGVGGGAPRPILAERFKTRQCRNYVSTGACPYEARCMFAHGDSDVRTYEENLRDGLVTEEAILEWRHERQLIKGGQGVAVVGTGGEKQIPPPPAYDVSVNAPPCVGVGVVGGGGFSVPHSYEMGGAVGARMSTAQNGSVGIPVNSGMPHDGNTDLQVYPYPTTFRQGEDATRSTSSLVNEEYSNTAHVFARGHAVDFSGPRQQEGSVYVFEEQPHVPIPYVFSQPSNPSVVYGHQQYRHADGEHNFTHRGFSNPPSAREERDITTAQLSSTRAAGGVSFFHSNKADIGSRNASSRSVSSAAAIGGYGPSTSAPTAGPYPHAYPHAYPASHATGVHQRNGTPFANSQSYSPLRQSVPSYPSPSSYPPILYQQPAISSTQRGVVISTVPDPACVYGSGNATGLSYMPPHPFEDTTQHIAMTGSTRTTNAVVGLPTMATVASSDTAAVSAYATTMTASGYYYNDTRRIAGSSSFIVSSRAAEYVSGRPDDVGVGQGGGGGGEYGRYTNNMYTPRAADEEEIADYFAHNEEDREGGHNQPSSTAADLIGFLSLLSTNVTNTDSEKKVVPPHSRNDPSGGQQHSYYSPQEVGEEEQQHQQQQEEGEPYLYHLSPEVSGLLSRREGVAPRPLEDSDANAWGVGQPLSSTTNEEMVLGSTVGSADLASHPIFGMAASKVNSVVFFPHSAGEHQSDGVCGGYVAAMANSVGVVGDGSNYGSKRSQHP